MPYSTWNPDPRLAPFVESVWVQESPADPEPVEPTRILPVGRVDLVAQFGDPFVRLEGGDERAFAPLHLTGQRTRPLSVRATGRTGMVVVNFLPWGAACFFGGLEHSLDASPDLGELVGRARAEALGEAVRDAASAGRRVHAVERFLLERLSRSRPDARAVEAARRIHRSNGNVSMESLAASLGLGRRQLLRVFRGAIGMPPKAFARIVRFQRALCLRRLGTEWSRVAHSCGYSDQAHLGHEVLDLSGCTPTELERRASRRHLGRFFNTDHPGRFYNTIYV